MDQTQNHYQVLGVRNFANPYEIDVAYKTLKESGLLDPISSLDVEMARNTLLVPQLRAEHDSSLVVASQPKSQSVDNQRARLNEHLASYQASEPVKAPRTTAEEFIFGLIIGVSSIFAVIGIIILGG